MIKISAIINTYNEETNIDECLKNIHWCDEIIIVDMYSTDRTIEISRKYTNKIYFYPKAKYVELGRNFALSKARYEWILIIDADEVLSSKSSNRIRKIIQNSSIDGYRFPRQQYINNKTYLKYGYFYPDYQIRLFRKDKGSYSGSIHDQPLIASKKVQTINNVVIKHNNTHSKYSAWVSFLKFIPYIKVEANDLAKSNKSTIIIFSSLIIDPLRHFYRSFIKLSGYKDGYNGFRASFLFCLYKKSIILLAIIYRIKK